MTPEQTAEVETFRTFIEHAPTHVQANPSILGWRTKHGNYVCNGCYSRILARGFTGSGSMPVWTDMPDQTRECVLCQRSPQCPQQP